MDPIPTLNSKQFELETDKSDFNSSQFFPSVVFLNNTSWHLHSSRNLVTFHVSTFCLQWNVYRPKKNMETRFKIHRQPYIHTSWIVAGFAYFGTFQICFGKEMSLLSTVDHFTFTRYLFSQIHSWNTLWCMTLLTLVILLSEDLLLRYDKYEIPSQEILFYEPKMQASQSHLLPDKVFVYEKWFMPYR